MQLTKDLDIEAILDCRGQHGYANLCLMAGSGRGLPIADGALNFKIGPRQCLTAAQGA